MVFAIIRLTYNYDLYDQLATHACSRLTPCAQARTLFTKQNFAPRFNDVHEVNLPTLQSAFCCWAIWCFGCHSFHLFDDSLRIQTKEWLGAIQNGPISRFFPASPTSHEINDDYFTQNKWSSARKISGHLGTIPPGCVNERPCFGLIGSSSNHRSQIQNLNVHGHSIPSRFKCSIGDSIGCEDVLYAFPRCQMLTVNFFFCVHERKQKQVSVVYEEKRKCLMLAHVILYTQIHAIHTRSRILAHR